MIDINWTLGVQAANFIVMLVFLNQFIFKPMLAHLEKREAEMKDLRDNVEDLRKKGEEALAEYEASVEKIRSDAAAAVAGARRDAQEAMSARLSASRKEFETQIQSARAKIQAETEAASSTLKSEIDNMARSMAGKILGRSI